MSAINFPEYVAQVNSILRFVSGSSMLTITEFQHDQRSEVRGMIRAKLQFVDGSELHMREFIDLTLAEPRMMYVYHYQMADGQMIFRYDNAAHRPPLGQAEHKHTEHEVVPSHVPSLLQVLDEVLGRLS